MTTVQQIKELYKVIKLNGQATTAKCIVGANANIYTNLGINLSGTTAVPNPYGVMIGQNSSAQGDHSIAIGKGAYAKGGCVAIGQYSTMTQSDDFKVVIGDGNASTSHNCFTSDGSVITIDNKTIVVGNSASAVSIGNVTSSRVTVGEGTDSTVRIGNETASYVAIGNGNRSTVRIGDNVNAQVDIGNKEGAAVNIGNGINSWVYLGYATSSHTCIGEGSRSTVEIGKAQYSHVSIGEGKLSTINIGNSFAGADIWTASGIRFKSPITSEIYVPIKFDSYTVNSTAAMASVNFPLFISSHLYTLHHTPKGTRYKVTIKSNVPWEASQSSRYLELCLIGPTTCIPLDRETVSDKNDTDYSRSVFFVDEDLSTTHNHLKLTIVPSSLEHHTAVYTINITMYIPLNSLALYLMQEAFS